jgi:aldehyde dehydrogenase (NAD+)
METISLEQEKKAMSAAELVQNQRNWFSAGASLDVDFRIAQLKKLRRLITEYESEIMDALLADLGKSKFEAFATEIGMSLNPIDHAIKNIPAWTRPERMPTPLFHFVGSSRIHSDPYGVALIIAPWNYPFQLAISPLAGAIAAGNTAIIKPSEVAPATSAILAKIINPNFDPGFLHVVEGGAEITTELLNEKFDYIFFTGGTTVGRIVYEAAAKYLTPVTLELGGKSPCIVDKNINLTITARRITWGKLLNSGQTCVAPDYLYVHKDIKASLIEAIKKEIERFYGKNPIENEEYGKIVNRRHFERLKSYLNTGNIVHGGKADDDKLKIEPTLVDSPSQDSSLLNDEIFGPILPIISFADVDEVIRYINAKPKPLALYVFSDDTDFQDNILKRTSSGGVSINDTIMHMTGEDMPFGGVGDSGIGAYHGQHSFDTFSHKKSVLKRTFFPDAPLRYPPYNKVSLNTLKLLIRRLL